MISPFGQSFPVIYGGKISDFQRHSQSISLETIKTQKNGISIQANFVQCHKKSNGILDWSLRPCWHGKWTWVCQVFIWGKIVFPVASFAGRLRVLQKDACLTFYLIATTHRRHWDTIYFRAQQSNSHGIHVATARRVNLNGTCLVFYRETLSCFIRNPLFLGSKFCCLRPGGRQSETWRDKRPIFRPLNI